jgi:hypothetical protein
MTPPSKPSLTTIRQLKPSLLSMISTSRFLGG